MTAHPQPPPEAALIRVRREAVIPRLSMSAAARRAAADGLGGFSVALWTKIENGYDQVARRVVLPYSGTPDKVARMARVVGITAAELAACRPDAAQVLAALAAVPPAAEPDYEQLARQYRDLATQQAEQLARFEAKFDRFINGREGRDKEESHDDQGNGSRRAG